MLVWPVSVSFFLNDQEGALTWNRGKEFSVRKRFVLLGGKQICQTELLCFLNVETCYVNFILRRLESSLAKIPNFWWWTSIMQHKLKCLKHYILDRGMRKTCFHMEFNFWLCGREIGIKCLVQKNCKDLFCFFVLSATNSFHTRSPGGRVFHQVQRQFFQAPSHLLLIGLRFGHLPLSNKKGWPKSPEKG